MADSPKRIPMPPTTDDTLAMMPPDPIRYYTKAEEEMFEARNKTLKARLKDKVHSIIRKVIERNVIHGQGD